MRFHAVAVAALLLVAACDRPLQPERPVELLVSPAADTVEVPVNMLGVDNRKPSTQLAVQIRGERGGSLPVQGVTWGISDTTFATVGSTGIVTGRSWKVDRAAPRHPVTGAPAVSPAMVQVWATAGALSDTATVMVYPPISGVRISLPSTVLVGRETMADALVETALPAETPGSKIVLRDQPIGWTSSDSTILAIGSDSRVRPKQAGQVTVSASFLGRTDSIRVVVITTGYSVTALGTLDGMPLRPSALNNSGQVVGSVEPAGGAAARAFVWQSGSASALLASAASSRAMDINNRAEIAGELMRADGTWSGFLWRQGELVEIPIRYQYSIEALNDAGAVLHWSKGSGAAVWKDGALMVLSPGSFQTWQRLMDLSTDGAATGEIFESMGPTTPYAVVWRDGSITKLARSRGSGAVATAINDRGQVVGYGMDPQNWSRRVGFFWNAGEGVEVRSLGGLQSEPADVNEHGVVVGTATDALDRAHGFVWKDGHTGRLTDLLVTAGWEIAAALRINDAGQILAMARRSGADTLQGVLLSPAP